MRTVYVNEKYGEVEMDAFKYLNLHGITQRAIARKGNTLFVFADSGFICSFEVDDVERAKQLYNSVKSIRTLNMVLDAFC